VLRAVSKPDKTRWLSVGLLSAHPMVLTELQQILFGHHMRLSSKQVPPSLAPELWHEEVPSAEVYVVDAQAGEAPTSALLKNIESRHPAARLVVIAQKFTEESSYLFLRGGAKGLLTYREARRQLPKALSQVAAGGFWVPRRVLSGFVDFILSSVPSGYWSGTTATNLSRREQEMLEGVLANLSNKEIANKSNISERTVKFHVSHLLEKFGVQRRADLILLWYQHHSVFGGIVMPGARVSATPSGARKPPLGSTAAFH